MQTAWIVFWYTEDGHRVMVAYDTREQAMGFIMAHPYRTFFLSKVKMDTWDTFPRTWSPE